jgi:acetyl-CoA acetyltransferase
VTEVLVAGVGMAPFGNHGPGSGLRLGVKAAIAALNDANVKFSEIDAVIVGTAHPLSPRGIYLARELGMTGVPVQHVSNASATGLAAIHEAKLTITAGNAKRVLVVGLDAPEKDMPVEDVIVGEGNYPPVVSFALWGRRRMHDTGMTAQHLARVTAKNWNYARQNPFAARRSPDPVSVERVLKSRMVADPFTSMMCTPWGEGAAAAVLCSSDAYVSRDERRPVRLSVSEFQTDRFSPEQILDGAIVGPPELTRTTAQAALVKAGLTPTDIDIVQVHDAFAIEEVIYYELLGFSEPGDTERLIDEGAFGPGSKKTFGLPEFSTDGGLIARGHPGAPTGLAQVWETVRRLRQDTAERHGLCHLLGGGSICIVQIFSSD